MHAHYYWPPSPVLTGLCWPFGWTVTQLFCLSPTIEFLCSTITRPVGLFFPTLNTPLSLWPTTLVPLASSSSYNRLLRIKMTARNPCYSFTQGLLLFYPILSCPIPFYSILFYPILSYAVPFHPILSYPVLYLLLFHSIICSAVLSKSYPITFHSILSNPIQSYPILS